MSLLCSKILGNTKSKANGILLLLLATNNKQKLTINKFVLEIENLKKLLKNLTGIKRKFLIKMFVINIEMLFGKCRND